MFYKGFSVRFGRKGVMQIIMIHYNNDSKSDTICKYQMY